MAKSHGESCVSFWVVCHYDVIRSEKFPAYARECLQLAEEAVEPDVQKSLIEWKPLWKRSGIYLVMKSSIPLDDEHSGIRDLKHRWDEEDKTRDELERQARRAFLKQEANELFAPLENYLTKLDKVIREANAAVEIDPTWEHLDERKLRRTAKVILRETAEHLSLDLTIEGVTIFYRNRPYRFTRAIEALIPVITSDVEQFITAQSQATTPAHLALIKGST